MVRRLAFEKLTKTSRPEVVVGQAACSALDVRVAIWSAAQDRRASPYGAASTSRASAADLPAERHLPSHWGVAINRLGRFYRTAATLYSSCSGHVSSSSLRVCHTWARRARFSYSMAILSSLSLGLPSASASAFFRVASARARQWSGW